MNTVVDASVVVAAVTDSGRAGTWAERILADGELFAPQLVLVEATNALRRLEMSRRLTRLEASEARRDVLDLEVTLLPFEPFADRVWELRGSVTSYDAWYVAAAEALEISLSTLDRRLSRAAGTTCRFRLPT